MKQKGVPYIIYGTSFFMGADSYKLALGTPDFHGILIIAMVPEVAFLGLNWASNADMFTPLPVNSDDKYDRKSFFDRSVNFLEHFGGWVAMDLAGRNSHFLRLSRCFFPRPLRHCSYHPANGRETLQHEPVLLGSGLHAVRQHRATGMAHSDCARLPNYGP